MTSPTKQTCSSGRVMGNPETEISAIENRPMHSPSTDPGRISPEKRASVQERSKLPMSRLAEHVLSKSLLLGSKIRVQVQRASTIVSIPSPRLRRT
jgi:hypothetical protein